MNNIPKDKIIKVIETFFPDANIYFFGSRAKGIAIDTGKPITMAEKGQINSRLDA